ncbi:MAG: glycosyltransferase [Actinomycetia bacterium]|nr:glycosyltransferase [Actinomycetes bacterium]
MRVVHVVATDAFAGVERYVTTVTRELAARGHEVTVVGGDQVRIGEALAGSGAHCVEGGRVHEAARALLRVGRGADLLHLHMTAAESAALMTWPLVRTPAICTRHFAARRGSSAAGHVAALLIPRRLSLQIAISRFVAASAGGGTVTILNGVPDAPATDPASHTVLVVQRLEREKHTHEALVAWAASGLADDGWELLIAGHGAERSSLEEAGRRLQLRNVTFLGARPDVADLRARAGMVLATAPAEPFGLSVVEAMAAGLPVVAADGGAHVETVGAVRPDHLYAPGAPDECAVLLRRLAGSLDLRRAAGTELRAFQQASLGVARHVDALEASYREVLAARGPSALASSVS